MKDDNQYDKILSILGQLQSTIASQQEDMAEIRKFKDDVLKTLQKFEDYKESRIHLPEMLQEVKDRMSTCNMECRHHTEETKSYFKKTDFLMTWYGRAAVLSWSINIIILILVAIGRFVDFEYTIR